MYSDVQNINNFYKFFIYIYSFEMYSIKKKQDYIKYIVYQLLYYYIVGRFRY